MKICGELLALILLLKVGSIAGTVPDHPSSWASCRILSRNLTTKTFNYTHRPYFSFRASWTHMRFPVEVFGKYIEHQNKSRSELSEKFKNDKHQEHTLISKQMEHCSRNLKLNGSEDIPRIEINDNCNPKALKAVPETCLKKIKEGLSYYHNQFSQLGNVKESKHNSDIRKVSHNLSKIILDLLKSIKSSVSSTDDKTANVAADNRSIETHDINDWELNCTLFRTLERFQSFSSLVARVFGHPSGNPSKHHNTRDC